MQYTHCTKATIKILYQSVNALKDRALLNPLSANVEYTPHGGDVTCCGASYRQNH